MSILFYYYAKESVVSLALGFCGRASESEDGGRKKGQSQDTL
jgi:hypothetical protein